MNTVNDGSSQQVAFSERSYYGARRTYITTSDSSAPPQLWSQSEVRTGCGRYTPTYPLNGPGQPSSVVPVRYARCTAGRTL